VTLFVIRVERNIEDRVERNTDIRVERNTDVRVERSTDGCEEPVFWQNNMGQTVFQLRSKWWHIHRLLSNL